MPGGRARPPCRRRRTRCPRHRLSAPSWWLHSRTLRDVVALRTTAARDSRSTAERPVPRLSTRSSWCGVEERLEQLEVVVRGSVEACIPARPRRRRSCPVTACGGCAGGAARRRSSIVEPARFERDRADARRCRTALLRYRDTGRATGRGRLQGPRHPTLASPAPATPPTSPIAVKPNATATTPHPRLFMDRA